MIDEVRDYLVNFQRSFCERIEQVEPIEKFRIDSWSRPDGGGGVTKILAGGAVFAKAAVNFSQISGENLPKAATDRRQIPTRHQFECLGVSIIVHPQNPYVPTMHANLRFFLVHGEGVRLHQKRAEEREVQEGAERRTGVYTSVHEDSSTAPTQQFTSSVAFPMKSTEPIWWFGGGFDLTPYYGFVEDCVHWHQAAKKACDPFGTDIYPLFKKNCDAYFYLPHRQEARGIGGLFFDDLYQSGFDPSFALVKSIGDQIIDAYFPIVMRRKDLPFTARERAFQQYRRGRYVEFNLIHDRGTLFGLQSGGRTESILASLPPDVTFIYDWKPEPGSAEERLYTEFLPPRDWAAVR